MTGGLLLSDDELVREFRTAKNRKIQIGILADRCLCAPYEVAKRLEELGQFDGTKLRADRFSRVYSPIYGASSRPRRGPAPSAPPIDELRAMELFNEGYDDLAIAEALGISKTRVRDWRFRMRLLRPRGGARQKKKQTEETAMENKNGTAASQDHMTVGGLVAALDNYLGQALYNATLQIDGRVLTGIFEVQIRTDGKQAVVNLRTKE